MGTFCGNWDAWLSNEIRLGKEKDDVCNWLSSYLKTKTISITLFKQISSMKHA